jgi:hypothetical protein
MARGQDTRWDDRRKVTNIAGPGSWFERYEGERRRGMTPVEGSEAVLGSPAGNVRRGSSPESMSRFYNYGPAETHKEARANYEDVKGSQSSLDEWAKSKGYQK